MHARPGQARASRQEVTSLQQCVVREKRGCWLSGYLFLRGLYSSSRLPYLLYHSFLFFPVLLILIFSTCASSATPHITHVGNSREQACGAASLE